MSKPDWADMKFNLNNSDDDDDDDEQQRQAEEEEAQRQAEEAQRQAEEAERQNRLLEIQRQMFTSTGIDPTAGIDEAELEPDIQQELAEQQERQRIQKLQGQAMLANLKPGNEGRYTVDAQGIVYDRGKRINGGKRRRKTRRRTRKSKKSKKSKKSRRHRR
jgi:hypothetical protein